MSSSNSLLSTTPTPITRFLILSSPYASYVRTAVEVLLWRHGRGKGWSWAVVMGWWAVCLGGWEVVRFLLPPLLLFLYFLPSLPLPRIFHSSPTRPNQPQPISTSSSSPRPRKKEAPTAQNLLTTVSDFSSIHSLLCQAWPEWLETPDRRLEAFGYKRVARGLGGVWIVWVVGGWVLGLRVMLGLIGTVLLLLPSPYFRPLLNATQSSCFLRRTTTFLSLLVLGPSPSSTSSPRDSSTTNIFSWAWKQAKSEEEDASKRLNKTTRGRSSSIKEVLWAGLTAAVPKKLASTKEEQLEEEREEREKEWQEEPVQFRFEVMENQRWWLALDWTTTLAPSDRPVWCDTHLNPTPPPSQFTLPPASTILLPDPNSTTHQIQRTAIWHWLDPDWSIALHLPNSPTATSFIPPSSRSPPSSSNNPLPLHHKAGDHHHNSNSHHNHNHPHHASQPLSPTSAATTTTKHMSLGEQALSKGLERLKAVSLQASSSSSLSLGSLTGGVVGGGASQSNSTSNAAVPMTTPSRSSSVDAGKTLFAMSQPEGGAASIAGAGGGAGGVGETMMMEVDDLDAGTDESGWSYGGNKWEAMSAKGGLGKFTRRRRWTRLALLTEHVQLVPLPVLPSSPSSTSLTNPTPIGLPLRRSSSLSRPTSSPTREKNTPLPALPSQVYAASASKTEGVGGGDGNGALRMRLKKAVEGQGQGESA